MTATTGNLAGTFSVSDGTDRLLVVLVCGYDSGGSSGQTFTASYGGKPLTQAFVQNSSQYQTWLGYLKEADIAGRSGDTVSVTVTGTHTDVVAYVASYSGVDQTTPVTDAGGVNTTLSLSLIGGPLNKEINGYGIYGWSCAGSRTRDTDTESYAASSNVGNPASFSYGVASKVFSSGGITDPLVTWSGAGRVAVSFITLHPDSAYPLPATTSISPATKTVGDASFTLTVNGANFVSGVSVVRLDGADRTTTFVSSTQLRAVIPASDLTTVGDRSVTVFTPAPGGGTSTTQTLAVRIAPVITWANPAPIVYGTTLSSTQLCATTGVPGIFTYSPDLGALLPAGNSQTLHVNFTPSDTATYRAVVAEVSVDVTARAITVTADARSKVYGAADPALTYTNTPSLVGGDSFSGALARAAGENAGTYAISQGTLALSANYTLTYVGANLTISPLAITVTADAQTKTYGDADPALTYTNSPALIGGDSFSGALARAAGENVGSFAITQGTLSLTSNYTLSYVGTTLTVSPKTLTITANDLSKDYRTTANFVGTEFTAVGLVEGDSVAAVTLTSTGAAADATVDGGPYAIVPGAAIGTGLDNYQIVYVNGSLMVTRASAGLVLTSSVVESDQGRSLTFTVTTSVPGATGMVTSIDGATVLGRTALAEGTATFDTSTLDPGTHSITAVYSGDANFAGSTSQALDITVSTPASAGLMWALICALVGGAGFRALPPAAGPAPQTQTAVRRQHNRRGCRGCRWRHCRQRDGVAHRRECRHLFHPAGKGAREKPEEG